MVQNQIDSDSSNQQSNIGNVTMDSPQIAIILYVIATGWINRSSIRIKNITNAVIYCI